MNTLDRIYDNARSLNDMGLHERMEYQRIHDRAVISQGFMRNTKVELKTLAGKRPHSFAIENIQNN